MIAVGIIALELWHLYAPPSPQFELVSRRAREIALTAWDRWQRPDSKVVAAEEATPRSEPPAFQVPLDAFPVPPPTPSTWGTATASSGTTVQPAAWPAPVEVDMTASPPPANTDRLAELLGQLEQLGGRDTKLTPWGTAGQVYRFCCRASWTESPQITRHFESVATDPLAAVEDVVAQVKSWRSARQSYE